MTISPDRGICFPRAKTRLRTVYKRLLAQAYQDFVTSDALTERMFKVFHDLQDGAFVSVESIGQAPAEPGESDPPHIS